jgi:hypothetical protein
VSSLDEQSARGAASIRHALKELKRTLAIGQIGVIGGAFSVTGPKQYWIKSKSRGGGAEMLAGLDRAKVCTLIENANAWLTMSKSSRTLVRHVAGKLIAVPQ